jgi:rubrerythrin
MQKYVCTVCGYIYDEALEFPDDFSCPLCGASREEFELQEEKQNDEQTYVSEKDQTAQVSFQSSTKLVPELSNAQLSVVFSNLAKGCEKQYLPKESELFTQLSEYYKSVSEKVEGDSFDVIKALLQEDLGTKFAVATKIAGQEADRGALRALTWSEKVSKILNSVYVRYEKQEQALLENTNVYVCEICGFLSINDSPPDICPVCKVPSMKLMEVQRGSL